MKTRLVLAALLLLASACSGEQCWPTELRKELEGCPSTHPYRNPWHPELCYATPQEATP